MNNIYINNQKYREIKNKIIELINDAQFEIIIMSYRFSNISIVEAIENFLIKTKNNPYVNVFIAIDTDESTNPNDNTLNNIQTSYTNEQFFDYLLKLKNQFPDKVKINMHNTGKTMHHKMLLIDREILGTGSFNFTHKADNENYENFFVTSSKHAPQAVQKAIQEAYNIMDIPFREKTLENINVSIYPCIDNGYAIKTLYYEDTQTFISPITPKLVCSAQNFMKLEIEIEPDNFRKIIPNYDSKLSQYQCVFKFKNNSPKYIKIHFYGWDGSCHTVEKLIDIKNNWPLSSENISEFKETQHQFIHKSSKFYSQIINQLKNLNYEHLYTSHS